MSDDRHGYQSESGDDRQQQHQQQSSSSSSSSAPVVDNSTRPMWSLSLSNLNPDLKDEEIKSFFQELIGGKDVFTAQVVRNEQGESKGYAFVHYLTSASYLAALDEYSEGIEIAGRFTKASPADDKRKIYVRGLPKDMSEATIRDEIEAITGKCDSFNISANGDFCFITYVNFFIADRAIKLLNSTQLGGNSLRAEQAKSREVRGSDDSTSTTSLHVRNISRNTTRESLEEHFASCGKIRECRVPKPRDGGSGSNVGFAFVEFEDPEDARKAISRLARSELDGSTIEVCFSRSKNANSRRDDDRRGGSSRRDDDRRSDRYDDRYSRAAPMGYPPYGMYPGMAAAMGGGRGGAPFPPYAAYAPYMYPGMAAAMSGMGGGAGAGGAQSLMSARVTVSNNGSGGGSRDSTTAFPSSGSAVYAMPPGMTAYSNMFDPRYAAMYASMMNGTAPGNLNMAGAAGAGGAAMTSSSSKKDSKRRSSRSRSPKQRRDRSPSGSRSRSRSRDRKRR